MNGNVIVLDIGKTFSKLSLWGEGGALVAQESLANRSIDAGPFRAIDTDSIERWMVNTLHTFAGQHRIDAIIPVAHGATGALVRNDGLACPVFDYESPVPQEIRETYNQQRDSFEETGSPAQSLGLNLGVQLHWLEQLYPDAFTAGVQFLTWPQYWAWRLSGIASTEVTSLACHTDLWFPEKRCPSGLADVRGWSGMFAPIRNAGDMLGPLRAEIADGHDGLGDTQVLCGIHDSNASLLGARSFAEFDGREFTTLATGTWFVTMRTPGNDNPFRIGDLPENRDCLVNCDVAGNMVPTSLFMGGRELSTVLGDEVEHLDASEQQISMIDAVPRVIESGAMLLPTFTPGVGPYPDNEGCWIREPTDSSSRYAAACLYAALLAETCLSFLGSTGRVLIDGRFSNAQVFVRALASLCPDTEFYTSDTDLDLALGAVQLVRYTPAQSRSVTRIQPLNDNLAIYAEVWRQAACR